MKLFIFSAILLFCSCEYKKEAIGFYDTIYVFGDKSLYDNMKESLRITLGSPLDLPVEEYRYKLEHRSYDEFDRYKMGKNVLFLIAKDREGPLNTVPDHLLGPNAKAAMERGELNFFMAKNAYAEDQALLFYVVQKAANAEAEFVEQFFRVNTFEQFNNYTLERLRNASFAYGENLASSNEISAKLDVRFRHPAKYKIVDFSLDKDSIQFSLFANPPTRWIWGKSIQLNIGDTVTVDRVLALRDEMTNRFFDGDSVDRENIIYSSVKEKDGLNYLRIQGSYITYKEGNKTPIGGGPFISYAFYDKATQSMWLIDGHLYLPGKRKSLKLLEIESILTSFHPRAIKEDN
jgi:hypothetical protein